VAERVDCGDAARVLLTRLHLVVVEEHLVESGRTVTSTLGRLRWKTAARSAPFVGRVVAHDEKRERNGGSPMASTA
jgi:hypothetical protein